MKSTNTLLSAPFTLKLVGYILILSSLLDYAFLLTGLDVSDKQALGAGITGLVDRGVIPMIGLALTMAGYWLERLADLPARSKLFRTIALLISAILGLIFLVLAPVHINNTSNVAKVALEKVGEQAKNAEGQVDQQVQQRQAELAELLKDGKRFDEQLKQLNDAIANKQVPESQLPQLQQLQKDLQEIKSNPAALQAKAQKSREEMLNKIRDDKSKEEKRINKEAGRSNFRTGLNSLLLSIGYLIISWVGLNDLGVFGRSNKAPRRAPAK
jgi:ABC-type multidrug transport system fused ATPase/permease subunit